MEAQESGILVVGAGQAGISLVTALRELGDLTPVVLVGDESEPPYERPPLSKSYLRGEHDRASLVFRDFEAIDDKTAYLLSIGEGQMSCIYEATDGGRRGASPT